MHVARVVGTAGTRRRANILRVEVGVDLLPQLLSVSGGRGRQGLRLARCKLHSQVLILFAHNLYLSMRKVVTLTTVNVNPDPLDTTASNDQPSNNAPYSRLLACEPGIHWGSRWAHPPGGDGPCAPSEMTAC